jgi:hypothetical protein
MAISISVSPLTQPRPSPLPASRVGRQDASVATASEVPDRLPRVAVSLLDATPASKLVADVIAIVLPARYTLAATAEAAAADDDDDDADSLAAEPIVVETVTAPSGAPTSASTTVSTRPCSAAIAL